MKKEVALTVIFIISTITLLEIYVFEPDEEPMNQFRQILFVLTMIVFLFWFVVGNIFIIVFCDFLEELYQNNRVYERVNNTIV